MEMERAILALLLIGSCIVSVTPLNKTQVHTAIEYIKKTFKLADTRQYAYVAVFSKQECDSLSSNNNNLQILQNEDAAGITDALNNEQRIYEGKQMVLATYGAPGFHAEYRLLFPPNGSDVSAVQQLVNTNPNATCAIFYSLNTPCVGICTNTTNKRNIIQKLPVFDKYNNNKAFVYSIVYGMDIKNKKIGKEKIWDGLAKMNYKMDVYRCFPNKCRKCFEYKNKGHCTN